MALVDTTYYSGTYKGIAISDATEFSQLSDKAESILDGFVQNYVTSWNFEKYIDLKTSENNTRIKTAICQEIEVLFHSNGLQATTGGADAGQVEMFGGLPLSVTAKNNILQVLKDHNLHYKGI